MEMSVGSPEPIFFFYLYQTIGNKKERCASELKGAQWKIKCHI